MAAARGRVKIALQPDPASPGQTLKLVVAENGAPLRGETPRLFLDETNLLNPEATQCEYWAKLRDEFRLNTVRVLAYREPQSFSGGCGWNCAHDFELYSATDADTNQDGILDSRDSGKANWDELMNRTVTALDVWVDVAALYGFYVIIDYHPIGGYDVFDAYEWWKVIAPRYKDRTHVIYEFTNEPVQWSSDKYTGADRDYQSETYTYLRALAPNTHIVLWSFPKSKVETSGGDTMLEVVQDTNGISYQNASVAFHIYGWNAPNINNLKRAYPVLNTEIGGITTAEFNSRVAMMTGVGIDSWILLDGTVSGKAVTVSWAADPFLANQHAQCTRVYLPVVSRHPPP